MYCNKRTRRGFGLAGKEDGASVAGHYVGAGEGDRERPSLVSRAPS